MSVPVQTPSKEYIANGTTTAFPLEFNCDKAEYLIVTLNGEEAPVGSWTLANDTVTFNVAPLNGVVVNLERNTPFQRTTNYQLYDNSFRPSAVNKDFDLIWWKLQELGYRDQVIWLALVKEIADRIAGDDNLQNQINTIDEWLTDLQQNVNENTNDISQLVNDLSKEIADRITGDQILKDMFISMIDEAINEGTINALAITHLDSLEALEGVTNVWDGRTIYIKDLGNYRYDALTTSWAKAYQDADNVKYGDKTQKQINEEQNERKSVKLWATSLVDALSKYNSVDFDEDEIINAPVVLTSGKSITSNSHELNQTSPTTIAIESDYSAADTIISGLHIVQDKTGPISGGTNNNHASIKYRGGLRNIIRDVVINGQLGISFGMGEIGSSDRRSKYNTAENIVMLNTHMGVEHIGSSYNHTRNIVIAPTEFKGIFHGIRLPGYDKIENPAETAHAPCHGNTGSDYFIKNMTNGISAQNSAKYNSYDRIFVTETDRAVQILQGTVIGNNPTLNHFNVIAEKVGQAIVNQSGNHNDFEILIDGGAFTDQGIQELTGYAGKGFNRYSGIIKNSAKTAAQFRYSHNLYGLQVSKATGNGANVNGNYGGGLIIVDGATGTGVALAGNYNNMQVVATECLNALVVSGSGNTVNIQTDGNVQISGSGNTIIGRIGGNLTVTGNENKFIGEVVGTVTRTGTTGNDFTGLKGWSDNIVLSKQTTDMAGRVTVAVPKHTSAQIRNIYATIPTNTSEWSLKVISISGANVIFELQNNTGNAVPSTAVAFNYTYSCS
ncbi:phage tail fiber protein [Acinetobacter baumannii]|uniref:phage tail fiber protein n=1 Tax=Acinetobacter baumannii TaxID=470 RepID=UPI0034E2A20F